LGKQAERKISNDTLNVKTFNSDYAIAVLNRSGATQTFTINFTDLGLNDKYEIKIYGSIK
jgi:alpha-galactosidase